MKLTPALVLLATATAASAQTAKPAVHRAPATTTAAAPTCVKLPELSSKIPALPAGTPCAHALYTITTTPSVKLEYVSPLEGAGLSEALGIETSSFSLAYTDIKQGTGAPATLHKWLTIHYTGWLVDGTKFDSSLDRNDPINIPYGEHHVIPGWDTGFAGMKVGSKRRLFIPYQLAYGPQAHQQIPGKSMLVFDVELLAVSDTEPKPKTPPTPPAPPAKPAPETLTPGSTPPPPPPSGNPTSGTTTVPPATPNPAADPTKPTATPPKP